MQRRPATTAGFESPSAVPNVVTKTSEADGRVCCAVGEAGMALAASTVASLPTTSATAKVYLV